MAFLNILIRSAPRLNTGGSCLYQQKVLVGREICEATSSSVRSHHLTDIRKVGRMVHQNAFYFTSRTFTSIMENMYLICYSRCNVIYKKLCQQNRLFSKTNKTFKFNTKFQHDVQVYSYKNEKFYKVLSYFGLVQMAVCGYLSLFAVRNLKQVPTLVTDTSELPWWKVLLQKEEQYKNYLSILCLAAGGTVLFITVLYPRRVVRSLWILAGGGEVRVTTYKWLGQTQTFKKPLEHISFLQSRRGNGQYIPFKIKGKNFYYLIDKQGCFYNTDLFDFVIGLKRSFR